MHDRRKQRRGLYRIRYPGGLVSDIRTQEIDGTEELTIAEPLYRARGYTPPFEDLPWQSDYLAAERRNAAQSAEGLSGAASQGPGTRDAGVLR